MNGLPMLVRNHLPLIFGSVLAVCLIFFFCYLKFCVVGDYRLRNLRPPGRRNPHGDRSHSMHTSTDYETDTTTALVPILKTGPSYWENFRKNRETERMCESDSFFQLPPDDITYCKFGSMSHSLFNELQEEMGLELPKETLLMQHRDSGESWRNVEFFNYPGIAMEEFMDVFSEIPLDELDNLEKQRDREVLV